VRRAERERVRRLEEQKIRRDEIQEGDPPLLLEGLEICSESLTVPAKLLS
jgi:hypothetical protein